MLEISRKKKKIKKTRWTISPDVQQLNRQIGKV